MFFDNWQFANWFVLYLAIINLIALVIFAMDKHKARKRKRRIPEIQLMLAALIGGSIGAIIGMKMFHHKTKHNKFRFGLPLILLLHLAIALVIYWIYYII